MFLLFVQKGNKYIEFVGVTSMLVIVKKIDKEEPPIVDKFKIKRKTCEKVSFFKKET